MDALSEAILRLLKRQETTERRLEGIEKALGIVSPETPPQPKRETPPPVEPALPSPPFPAPVTEPARPQALETLMGLTWINRVAVVTCMLAAAFFFKYAVDSQWIGESGRVGLGVLVAVVALGFAEHFWRSGQRIFGQGLCGLGAALLYLSVYATFGFYHLLPQAAVFALMIAVTAATGALSIRYASLAIAALALLGGYVTPALLSTGEDRPWFLFSYVFILNVGAIVLARREGWRRLEALAFAGTVFLYWGWINFPVAAAKRLPAAFFALLFYALFAALNGRVVFYAAQILAPLAIAAIWRQQPAPYFLTTLALSAGGLAVAGRRGWSPAALVTFAALSVSCSAYGLDRPVVSVASSLLFLTAGFLLFFSWLPWRMLARGLPVRASDLFLLVANAAGYYGSSYALLEADYRSYLGLFAALLASAHLELGWEIRKTQAADERPALLSLGVGLALLTLAVPIQFTGFRITMAWALEAAALAWIAARMRSARLEYAALAVFTLVMFRLVAIDSWIYAAPESYTAIANERCLTFFIAAAVFWAAAWWLKEAPRWMRLAAYVAGHFAMLWTLTLEVLGWAGRTAAAENLASVQSIGVSILLAAYAVLLIGLGVLTRSTINRVLGLILIAFVVGKLYLYDVWLLRRIYRVAAFSGLGALLLAASYLYSRFRNSIESWWKDNKREA